MLDPDRQARRLSTWSCTTSGDIDIDSHHTVEDTSLAFGAALRAGARRQGRASAGSATRSSRSTRRWPRPSSTCPAGPTSCNRRARAHVALDDRHLRHGSLTRHVWESLAFHAQIACTCACSYGRNPHHIVEAQFKAVARALRDAVELDPRVVGVPSTKGAL